MHARKKSRLIKWIRPFVWLILLVLSLVVFSISWLYFNKERVGNFIIGELNKSLKSEISVKEVDMVFISTFPLVSIEFKDVVGKEVLIEGKSNDTLFSAGFVYLKFNLIDIYKKKYLIKQIRVEDAFFRMKVFSDGSNNYTIWKTSEEGTAILLDLKKIYIKNSHFSYQNYQSKQYYDLTLNKSVSSGEFNSGWNRIKTTNDLIINTIQVNKTIFARNLPALLDMTLLHDENKASITISDNQLILNELPFVVNGSYVYSDKSFVDAEIKSRKISLKELLAILPEQYRDVLGASKATGMLDVNVVLKGRIDEQYSPTITADFKINDGTLENKKNKVFVKKINLVGNFTNGSRQSLGTSKLSVSQFSANVNDGFFKGDFVLTDLNNPTLAGKLSADLDLSILHSLFSIKNIDSLSGKLKADLTVSGKVADFSKGSAFALEQCKINGEAFINNGNVKFSALRYPIRDLNTQVLFSNNQIEIDYLSANLFKSGISFSGTLRNLPGYLFFDKEMFVAGSGIVSNLNIEEVFNDSKSDASSGKLLPKNIAADIMLTATNFQYRNLKSNDIKARLFLKENKLSLEDVGISAWGGRLTGDVSMIESEKGLTVQGDTRIGNIDVGNVLSTFNNFNQKMFTPDNLKGKLTSDIKFSFEYRHPTGIDLASLKTVVDLKLENGELINITPLMKLSKFLDEASLRHIKFNTVTNSFVIQNRSIEIPEMEVKSNAVNFHVYGKHSFDDSIEYHIRLNLSELASKRVKERRMKEQAAFGNYEAEENEKIPIHILVTRTTENPKFKYDMPSAKQTIKEGIEKEKKELKETLQNEFTTPEERREKQNWEIQEKGNYIIEWEDTVKKVEPKQKKPDTEFVIEW